MKKSLLIFSFLIISGLFNLNSMEDPGKGKVHGNNFEREIQDDKALQSKINMNIYNHTDYKITIALTQDSSLYEGQKPPFLILKQIMPKQHEKINLGDKKFLLLDPHEYLYIGHSKDNEEFSEGTNKIYLKPIINSAKILKDLEEIKIDVYHYNPVGVKFVIGRYYLKIVTSFKLKRNDSYISKSELLKLYKYEKSISPIEESYDIYEGDIIDISKDDEDFTDLLYIDPAAKDISAPSDASLYDKEEGEFQKEQINAEICNNTKYNITVALTSESTESSAAPPFEILSIIKPGQCTDINFSHDKFKDILDNNKFLYIEYSRDKEIYAITKNKVYLTPIIAYKNAINNFEKIKIDVNPYDYKLFGSRFWVTLKKSFKLIGNNDYISESDFLELYRK